METPLSKEEIFDHLRPCDRPFDPQTQWYCYLINHQFLRPEYVFCSDWGEPMSSISELARYSQQLARKRRGLPDHLVADVNSPFFEGALMLHLGHGLCTVLETNQEEDTVVVSTENYGIKTYRLSYVLTRKSIFVVETKPPTDSSS